MKITQEQFNSAQKTFSQKSLSSSQKNIMLSNIYGGDIKVNQKVVISPFSSYFVFFRQKVFAFVIVFAFLLSTTIYASAESLPGDLLYGMKINALEPIGLALQTSIESKNDYKISLIQKRINELEKLDERGDLSDASKKQSLNAAIKIINTLKTSGMLDENGGNVDLLNKIRAYNFLIGSDLGIEMNSILGNNSGFEIEDNYVNLLKEGSMDTETTQDQEEETIINEDNSGSQEIIEFPEGLPSSFLDIENNIDTKTNIFGL